MNNEVITNISCHNSLLDLWEDEFPTDKWHFNRDGIISLEHWSNSEVKVLFILKETNKAKQNVVDAIRRALVTKSSGWWRGKVLRRVGRWAYGLINYSSEIPSFKDAKSYGKDATWNVAYINMRKTAGGARTNKNAFNSHIKEYAPYIRRQIELINPEIVVLGGTFKTVKEYIFPELKHECKRIHTYNDIVFINAFHPAARTNSSGLYYQVLDCYHNYIENQ